MRPNESSLRGASGSASAPSAIRAGSGKPKTASAAAPVVAVVGATGAVGVEMLGCLEKRRFPLSGLRLLASSRSAGKTLPFNGEELVVEELNDATLAGVDIALFSAGSAVSRRYAPVVARSGGVAVDNSSAFRMDPAVPLVIPEINPGTLRRHEGIVANPNCCVLVAIVPLWPIHRQNRIKRMIVSTYQAASGAGAAAMEELRESTRAYLDGRDYAPRVLPHPYAFNLFSHNTRVDAHTGYNDEESKIANETHKIFGDSEIRISATCVRVPVLRAHSISITIECERPIAPSEARALLQDAPGVRLVDNIEKNYFPMPRDATGRDEILVGRIRQDLSDPSGRSIALFAVGDQLLKGAALNAVQIAERLMPERPMQGGAPGN